MKKIFVIAVLIIGAIVVTVMVMTSNSTRCPKCRKVVDPIQNKASRWEAVVIGASGGGAAGTATGAYFGAGFGIAGGPIAIPATGVGATFGGVIGGLSGGIGGFLFADGKLKCPYCGEVFRPLKK